jgi:hypothetical protein
MTMPILWLVELIDNWIELVEIGEFAGTALQSWLPKSKQFTTMATIN